MELFKEILNILYLLSGPFIAIFAYFALQQIKVAKESISINSTRDSLKLTAEQVKYYNNIIIPLQNEFNTYIKSIGTKAFQAKAFIPDKAFDTNFEGIVRKLVPLANEIESFSLYFTSGVASEEQAYHSLSFTYCSNIGEILPLISEVANGKHAYTATAELYSIWQNRNENENLLKNKSEIDVRLSSIKAKCIKPIGT
ncbi:MAG: hypothetical protein PHN18_01545 [Sulfurospirillaceae bacterium]|nr:hypothetical protein [Sulfurospirillaceae bacterium]MDD2827854.1 hypothetical protein [Sulfurospirillaceae bacterium]